MRGRLIGLGRLFRPYRLLLSLLHLLGPAYDDLSGREVYRAAAGVAVADVLSGQFQAVLFVAGVFASRGEELLEHVEHGASPGPGSLAA